MTSAEHLLETELLSLTQSTTGTSRRGPLSLHLLEAWLLRCTPLALTTQGVLTTWGLRVLQIALRAALDIAEEQQTLPPGVVHWLTDTLLPAVFPTSGFDEDHQQLACLLARVLGVMARMQHPVPPAPPQDL